MAPTSLVMAAASQLGPMILIWWLCVVITKLSGSWIGKFSNLVLIVVSFRQGKPVLEFPSNQVPKIDGLAWDKDSDSLAILTQSHVISIWSMGQRKF